LDLKERQWKLRDTESRHRRVEGERERERYFKRKGVLLMAKSLGGWYLYRFGKYAVFCKTIWTEIVLNA
jgi:hypothetical protein